MRVSVVRRPSASEMKQYHLLRSEIFISERGWRLPCHDGATLDDGYDARSTFSFMHEQNHLAGAARATRLTDGFPHEDLFFCHEEQISNFRRDISTLTSVAVRKPYRGTRVVDSAANHRTVAAEMIAALLRRDATLKVMLLTTGMDNSAFFFRQRGFKIIDPPFHVSGFHSPVVNMGGDRSTFRPQLAECDPHPLLEYFQQKERELLGKEAFADFIFRNRETR